MSNPILVERTRGQIVESFHSGSICLVNKQGEIIFSLGDVNQLSFTRSALKPFQSIPLIESGAADGFNLTDQEIAVTCGSHNAEAEHLQAVNSILKKIELDKSNLKCGPQLPTGRIPRNEIRKTGAKAEDIHNNCSGKHAGFLALCKYLGWSTDNYIDVEHTSQILIKNTCAELFEIAPEAFILGEDGCSAPNYATTLYQQAIGYKNLVSNNHSQVRNLSCKRIVQACLRNPLLVAGRERYCTELIEASKGKVFGKTGADGVYCMSFPDLGFGCAIKIDDGKMGPQYFVAQALINALGIDLKGKLYHYISSPVKNWNKHNVGVQGLSNVLINALKNL
ncbi:MAG: asparaginase [Bacteroidia bacterium]